MTDTTLGHSVILSLSESASTMPRARDSMYAGAFLGADTAILTNAGEKPACELMPGDRIPTYDRGTLPLLGLCTLHVPVGLLLSTPGLRPITLSDTAFPGSTGLCMSPGQTVLHRSAMAEALFAEPDVLVQADDLARVGMGTRAMPRNGVTYVGLLFETHALVMANGLWCASNLASRPYHDHGQHWRFAPGHSLDTVNHAACARTIITPHEATALLHADAHQSTTTTHRHTRIQSVGG